MRMIINANRRMDHTVVRGRVGDHNDLAMSGAEAMGRALATAVGISPIVLGAPESALNAGWAVELDAAMPLLRDVQRRFEEVLSRGAVSIAAVNRCAVALATLPTVLRTRPDACIVWLDAHADLNTPETSTTGYLGGLALSGPMGLWTSGLGAGLALDQVVLVGVRDVDPPEADLIARHGIPVVLADHGGDAFGDELRAAIAGRPVYVHLDCDVLHPGIVPTDYQVAGGMTLAALRVAASVIAEVELIGLEVAEFQVAWGAGGAPVPPDPVVGALGPILRR